MKKITVLFGNYGSGKTELSLNLALKLAKVHSDVSLVDLDIVNPYFRSSEHTAMLKEQGIRVVAPVYANTAVDLPALPPDIYTAFQGGHAVLDCGGDSVGAAALGSLKAQFDAKRDQVEVLFVINTNRPFQSDAQQLAESLARIEQSARLSADGLVLNTNLGTGTSGQELEEGLSIARELSESTGKPIRYISGTKQALENFDALHADFPAERIELKIFTRPEWL
jgi:signal recognition particle GTPase